METSYSLSVLPSVLSEGDSEPLGKLLDARELHAVPINATLLLLKLIELVSKGQEHRFSTENFVVISDLSQSELKQSINPNGRQYKPIVPSSRLRTPPGM